MKRKKTSDLGNNQTIREAIQKIAWRGLVNSSTGTVSDTEKITGFVAKIHTDGDLAGTIDVQEYNGIPISANGDNKIGYHEGVYLSSIQNNEKGYIIVPKLYSEVTITIDPDSKRRYVSMFSHVDIIQLDAHETITIGVTEREPYEVDNEDAPEIENLPETGVASKTTYLKDSIKTTVQGASDADHTSSLMDAKQMKWVAGDDKSSLLIDPKKVEAKHDKATLQLTDSDITTQLGKSKVKVEDGTVYVGSDSGTDDAVLGSELASILSELAGYIGQIITTTALGPQPPVNMASFISLKARIESFKASHSGFLTKKVQIQK